MNSKDIVAIASDEQAFRLYVIEKLENHEHRLTSIENKQTDFQQTVLKRLDNLEYEQRLLHSKVDSLQTSVYWVLGVITLFLTALGMIGIAATIISAFRKSEKQSDDKVNLTFSQVTELLLRGTAQHKEG